MRSIRYMAVLMGMLGMFISCGQEGMDDQREGKGEMSLSLSAEDANDFIHVVTKSGEEYVNPDSLRVSVTDSRGSIVASFRTYKEMKENDGKGLPLSLPVGSYTVKAWYDTDGAPSAIPYLYGEEAFTVSYNALARVNLTCRYQCIKVRVQTTAAFDAICKDNYKLRLSTSANESVELTKKDYWIFLRKACDSMKAWVDLETVDGRNLSFSYDLLKKDNEPFRWKNSIVVRLDIEGTQSLTLETEIR